MSGICESKILNELIVVKRSGQRVGFNSTKIAIAIKNAFDQIMPFNSEKKINKVYEDVLKYIVENYSDRKTINVEDIQDIIERKLKENNYKDVYIAFSDYRDRRAASRKAFGIKHQHKFAKAIERIISDNAENKYADINPEDILRNYGKTISCEYTKTYVLDNKLVRAHEEGSLYIHNLDYFNLGKLSSAHLIFDNYINDNFPREFINMAISAKNEIDGEIAIDSLDELLCPLVIKKFKNKFLRLLEKYLSIIDLLEYINVSKVKEILDRETKINFELDIFDNFILNDKIKNIFRTAYDDATKYLLDYLKKSISEILISLNNNQAENKKYSISLGTDNNYEKLLIRNIYLNEIEMLSPLKNVATIFKIKKDSNTELLLRISELVINGKNILFIFDDTSYNLSDYESVEYLSDGKRIFENTIYDTVGSKGRMITSSITVNVGRLGFKYENKNIADFYNELGELLELAKTGLVNIFEVVGDKTKKNYRAIFNGNIIDDDKLEMDQKIRKVIKKGVLNLELAGLKECVINLESDPVKQKELLKEILAYVKEKIDTFTKEAKLNFIVSETNKHRPLKKLMELDKAIYGIRKNINDNDCYGRIADLFEFKKELKSDLAYIGEYQKLLNGGNFVKIILSKSAKSKNVLEIINESLDSDVGFIKIEVGK